MIAVVGDELADLPVMGEIALSGTGQQELAPGFAFFSKSNTRKPASCRMDRTEKAGRPGPDHCNIRPGHSPHLLINNGPSLMNHSVDRTLVSRIKIPCIPHTIAGILLPQTAGHPAAEYLGNKIKTSKTFLPKYTISDASRFKKS